MVKQSAGSLVTLVLLLADAHLALSSDNNGEITPTVDFVLRELKSVREDLINLKKLQDEFSRLTSKYEVLKKEMHELKSERLQCNCNAALDKVEENEERDRRMLKNVRQTNVSSLQIGFHVATKQYQEHMHILQTVEFPDVITNVGGGFDPVTNMFITPATGLYFFTISILSHKGDDIETEILVNGQSLAYAYSGSEQTWGSGTTSTTVHLSEGDKVWVRILNNAAVNNGNIHVFGGGWSSFTGFKIA